MNATVRQNNACITWPKHHAMKTTVKETSTRSLRAGWALRPPVSTAEMTNMLNLDQ